MLKLVAALIACLILYVLAFRAATHAAPVAPGAIAKPAHAVQVRSRCYDRGGTRRYFSSYCSGH